MLGDHTVYVLIVAVKSYFSNCIADERPGAHCLMDPAYMMRQLLSA